MIHPTASVHPNAKLDSSVRIGPYSVVDEAVELGADCVIGPHVYLTGVTSVGARNRFHAGCVIGDAPQDLKYKDEPTRLRIGDDNIFREHVTVHRSNKLDEDTVIGCGGFFMQHSHVAHNCIIGDNVILAGGALLAGHVTVHDRAFISGNCVIHQFVRVGTLALMQGGSAISQDLPPFTIAQGTNALGGLNIIGLRRAGYSAADRLELKKLYHFLFRSGKNFRAAAAEARKEFSGPAARLMLDFVAEARRGICADAGRQRAASGQETE